jgi:hypothetical protein
MSPKYYYGRIASDSIRCVKLDRYDGTNEKFRVDVAEYQREGHGYTALSYEWGRDDPALNKKVTVDCSELSGDDDDVWDLAIRRNLHHALLDIKNSKFASEWFFIDQISIDQNDLGEKSIQVAKMDKVYSCADRVLTYLGPKEDEDGDALDLLSRIDDHFGDWFDELDRSFFTLDRYVRRGEIPPGIRRFRIDPDEQKAFEHLNRIVYGNRGYQQGLGLTSSWTTRLWMVQENLLNRNTYFFRGPKALNSRSIHLLSYCQAFGLLPYVKKNMDQVLPALKIADAFQDYHKEDERMSLTALMEDFGTNMDCSDPKDKIYALVGLADDSWDIVPKYEKDNVDVFTELVQKSVENTHSLGILNHVRLDLTDHHHEIENLSALRSRHESEKYWPSWVPIFKTRTPPKLGGKASGTMLPKVWFSQSYMRVCGLKVGAIRSEVHLYGFEDCAIAGRMVGINLWHLLHVLDNIRSKLVDSGVSSIDEKLCYLVLGNSSSPDPDRSDEQWRSVAGSAFRQFHRAIRHAYDSREDDHDRHDSYIRIETSELAGYVLAKANVYNRSVYLTDDGELILATAGCLPGDTICILFGGRTLYVLRRQQKKVNDEEYYLLLSPAFMDGYCNGEAFDDGGIMCDGNFINRVTLAVSKLVDGEYLDVENLDGRSYYSPNQTYRDRTGSAAERRCWDLGAEVRGYFLQQMGYTAQQYEAMPHAYRLDVIKEAIQGTDKLMPIAEWRKDWWDFLRKLIDAYLVPTPKWQQNQTAFLVA